MSSAATPAAAVAVVQVGRAPARAKVWGHRSPVADDDTVVVDMDETLIGAHSEK